MTDDDRDYWSSVVSSLAKIQMQSATIMARSIITAGMLSNNRFMNDGMRADGDMQGALERMSIASAMLVDGFIEAFEVEVEQDER